MQTETFRKLLAASGADALFIETDYLRRYLTGFYSTDGYAVVDGRGVFLVADPRYFEAAERDLAGSGVTVVAGAAKEALGLVAGAKKLGVPFALTDLKRAEVLRRNGAELVDCLPALARAMRTKSEEELSLIQRACDIAEEALSSVLPEIKEGMGEREVAALLEYRMRQSGASGTSFETIVAFGENGSVPHHETGERKLKFGDPVLIDFGCKYGGYCSDCTRTFLFGDDKKHEEFKQVYEHVLHAHLLVLEDLRAGMTGSEGDAIARNYLEAHGLGKYFTHSLGHGVGLQIHEGPVLSPRSGETLADGDVFSDEPGVYLAGKLGIRIEDTVYLKDGRAHSFMKGNKNLIIL